MLLFLDTFSDADTFDLYSQEAADSSSLRPTFHHRKTSCSTPKDTAFEQDLAAQLQDAKLDEEVTAKESPKEVVWQAADSPAGATDIRRSSGREGIADAQELPADAADWGSSSRVVDWGEDTTEDTRMDFRNAPSLPMLDHIYQKREHKNA